jgi:hypothetical protein
MATVYYADDGDYTAREAELLAGLDMEDRVPIRLGEHARMAWRFELHPTRAAAVAALIEVANNRIAVGQEAHRALAALKRDPDAPGAVDIAAVDAAIAIPVTVVDDDADDGDELDPDSTDLYEPDQGEPVAAAPAWRSDVPAMCCHRCHGHLLPDRMIICPDCGNKRCPKASDHDIACSGSNSPGQPGSVFGDPVASHLEPAGADVKGPAYHGQQS